MLKNYLKIALRNLYRRPGFAAIHIVGLAIGMACCGLMLLYVYHELSYDRFIKDSDRIWRISTEVGEGDRVRLQATMPLPLLKHLQSMPEVLAVVEAGSGGSPYFRRNGNWIQQAGIASASANVFGVFGYPMQVGDPGTALEEPGSIVLTTSLAEELYGTENPVGQILETESATYSVTGVMADVPANTHWPFRALVSRDRSDPLRQRLMNRWGWAYTHAYILTPQSFDAAGFEAKLNTIASNEQQDQIYRFHLQSLQDIHLQSNLEGELSIPGNTASLVIFSIVAVLILLIACFNFINLATVQFSKRVQEIGVRKAIGATRWQLAFQMLGESLLVSMLAALAALVLIDAFLPTLNGFVDRQISPGTMGSGLWFGSFAVLALLVGILAGSYPAMMVSAFRPAQIFRHKAVLGGRGWLRKGLVVCQFSVCMVFVIGAGVIANQYRYMKTKDLGFDREHILMIPTQDMEFASQYDLFKQRLLGYTSIVSVTAAMGQPGIWAPENAFRPDSNQTDFSLAYRWLGIDYDYLRTFDIELLNGRDLSREIASDENGAFILNESAVRALGLENPIGAEIQLQQNERKGRVVGVVKDFHHATLHEAISPVLLYIVDDVFYSDVMVRVMPGTDSASIARVEQVWKELFPNLPFEYSFYEDQLSRQYVTEERIGEIISFASAMAIVIACMGLLGLMVFTVENRTKEIGIRKVVGASAFQIVNLLSAEYFRLLLVAFLLAFPIALLAIQRWLNQFAFRIEIGPGLFILAAGLVLTIASLSVSYQSIKAATANPVEALRYE